MNDVQKWVSCHGNLREEILVTLHYFLVPLNSLTVQGPFEGCEWQPLGCLCYGGHLSTSTQDPVDSGGSLQWLINS